MKMWVDDIRTPPDETWTWFVDSELTIAFLKKFKEADEHKKIWNMDRSWIEVMSLDHDLGGDDTTRPIVLWCCENNFWPVEVRVHSMNPVGHFWLTSMIDRYKT